ncbi:MAG: RibD family protein [Candidatus Dormibacteraeota bacterium]|nr:RibD family protein [Candidatus Dormibacteraeota bacterium]
MVSRPYVLLSCAMSVDGYIDDAGPSRLELSNSEDFDRVDAERARADAILVGAGTVRRDDPRLLVRSPDRRRERLERGLPASPLRVTLTASGDLDPGRRIFAGDGAESLVYCSSPLAESLERGLRGRAAVVALGPALQLDALLGDLAGRGVGRLMVEGGSSLHTALLVQGLADELQLAVAPFLVGDPCAPRFVGPGSFPHGPANPMALAEVRRLGAVVVLRYLLRPSSSARGGSRPGP